jgi:precorrin-6Y C5,15-methyltransferase (decarboxylating)
MITRNAERFGVATQLHVHVHDVLDATDWPDAPDAVFVGGGWSRALWARLAARLPDGVRVVVNGVTLQTQQDLWSCYAAYGGELLQLSVATAEPLGRRFHAWTPARPIVQWTVGWRRAWAGRLPWQGGCDDTG